MGSAHRVIWGQPKLVQFEADLSRDTAESLALELVRELELDEDEATLRDVEKQIGVALQAGVADQQ